MGHWEQVAKENRSGSRLRSKWPPWLAVLGSIALWALIVYALLL